MSYKKNRAERVSAHVKSSTDGSDVTTGVTATISKDGGAFAAVGTAATHVSGGVWTVSLTAAEMNADHVSVRFAGTGALTATVNIRPSIKVVDDALDANNRVDLGTWLGVAPNALVSGRVDGSVGAMAADVLTNLAIQDDAISDTKIKTGAITASKFAAGAIDAAAIATNAIGAAEFAQAAADKVWSTAVRALTDKANFTLASNAVDAAQFTQAAADKVWATTVRALTDKAGFSLAASQAFDNTGQTTNQPADVKAWQGFTIPGTAMIENDGAGDGRWTTKALEQGPSGGGGGTDWSAAERANIRYALGVDGTKTQPTEVKRGRNMAFFFDNSATDTTKVVDNVGTTTIAGVEQFKTASQVFTTGTDVDGDHTRTHYLDTNVWAFQASATGLDVEVRFEMGAGSSPMVELALNVGLSAAGARSFFVQLWDNNLNQWDTVTEIFHSGGLGLDYFLQGLKADYTSAGGQVRLRFFDNNLSDGDTILWDYVEAGRQASTASFPSAAEIANAVNSNLSSNHGPGMWEGGVLGRTSIATLTSQTVFTLSAGSNLDDAYKDLYLRIAKVESATLQEDEDIVPVASYVGATRQVTLKRAPIFTIGVGMSVKLLTVTPEVTVVDVDAASANKVADHILRRALADARASSDGDAVKFRSILGGMAKLCNRIAAAAGTLTVYEEDDLTSFATQSLTTDTNAEPIVEANTN